MRDKLPLGFIAATFALVMVSPSAACDIPVLLSPPDGAETELGPYQLDWEDVYGATGYYLDVIGEPNPPNPYFVTESEFYSVWDGPHCPMLWRVRAVCGADTSDYSETWAIWVDCDSATEETAWFTIKSLFRE
jgi:hypothetical protein